MHSSYSGSACPSCRFAPSAAAVFVAIAIVAFGRRVAGDSLALDIAKTTR